MLFTTPAFLIFLLVVYGLYWSLHRKGQNRLILVASLFFYGWWDVRFLLLLITIASIDFFVALAMRPELPQWRRKYLLGLSIGTNIGALIYFKYFNFFSESFTRVLKSLGMAGDPITLQIILPLGISFYTFQALSYTIDVYRNRLPAVKSYTEYLCFITFFPHMVAGPIQQATHLLVQFAKDRHFSLEESKDGLRQMLWGFFKKMVVADQMALLVNPVFANPEAASGWKLLWASYYFAIQIYGDFSGYTDIAIGCAKLFGLHMTRNFAYPYFATNFQDFWKRWHMSLSNWFREYVYIPLGGNRFGETRTFVNIFIVFLVSGLWHGANWTFLIWGAFHGVLVILTAVCLKSAFLQGSWTRNKLFHVLACLLVFHVVVIGWVFFRANNLSDALLILRKAISAPLSGHFERPFLSVWAWAALLFALEWYNRHRQHGLEISRWPVPGRWLVYYGCVLAILLKSPLDYVPFIYFQF